jgi:hypothetical protein
MGMLEDAIRAYAVFADRGDAPDTPDAGRALLCVEGGQLKLTRDAGGVTTFGAGGGGRTQLVTQDADVSRSPLRHRTADEPRCAVN